MAKATNGNVPQEPATSASTLALANAQEIDLNETMPAPVEVRFVEWIRKPLTFDDGEAVTGEDGEPLYTYEPKPRTAHIGTFVPMYIFNALIASRAEIARLQDLRKAVEADENVSDNAAFAPMLEWVRAQVLNVWQLTEPAMTETRFKKGLAFEQVYGLFGRFFAHLLARWQAQQHLTARN